MKILYYNKELKRNLVKSEIEAIIKHYEEELGKKVCIIEYCREEQKQILKIMNMRNKEITTCIIEPGSLIVGTDTYLVTFSSDLDDTFPIISSTTYCIGARTHIRINWQDNFYYKENDLLFSIHRGFGVNGKDYTPYTIVKEDKKCHFVIEGEHEKFLLDLLNLKKVDLPTIYKWLKAIDEKLVYGISITFTDEENHHEEKLNVKEGQLTRYEKSYQKDEDLITLIYQDGKITVTSKQELCEEKNTKTKEVDVTEEIQKIKKLFLHN